jgi:hypothetical protein
MFKNKEFVGAISAYGYALNSLNKVKNEKKMEDETIKKLYISCL